MKDYSLLPDNDLKIEALHLAEEIFNFTYNDVCFPQSPFDELLIWTEDLADVYKEIRRRQDNRRN